MYASLPRDGTLVRVSSVTPSSWRPTVREHGWERPVAVPASLDELDGSLVGVVTLPLRLSWSGPVDRRVFDLAVEHDLRMLYEVVLTEGNIGDVRNYVDATELLRLWRDLWLSPHVRRAWQPLIAAATAA
jgi:hypothetical protein